MTLWTWVFLTGIIVNLGLSGWLFWQLRSLRTLKQAFNWDQEPEKLEDVLISISKIMERLKQRIDLNQADIKELRRRLIYSYQKSGLIRFNQLKEQGGNLSFSYALLDENDNGVVITNLHGRENSRMYTKPIVKGASEIQLTEEEKAAVKVAQETHENELKSITN